MYVASWIRSIFFAPFQNRTCVETILSFCPSFTTQKRMRLIQNAHKIHVVIMCKDKVHAIVHKPLCL